MTEYPMPDISASTITDRLLEGHTGKGPWNGFDPILAGAAVRQYVREECKKSVEEAFRRLLEKQHLAPVAAWSEVLREMFPPL